MSIAMVSEQNIIIDTDYRLPVSITGNPTTVEVTGDMKYFGYDWRSSDNEVKIYGTPRELLNGLNWHIEATYSDNTILERDIAFNVIPAAPIFGTLPDIHLYRGVPINLPIPIANPPNEVTANTLLLGLGLETNSEGALVDGEISADANFTVSQGVIELVAPHIGGDVMKNQPYTIEAGAPPALGTPVVSGLFGNFAEVTLPDVQHAIEYEWQFDGDDNWNRFGTGRGNIDLRNTTVEPGHLSATIKFPVVSGANAYQYQIENVDSGELTEWTDAVITIANNMITIIIPNLEEGQVYRAFFRVASPWISDTPVSVLVYGGRTVYSIEYKSSDRTNNELYIFHTGAPNGTIAPRIKRLLLPTTLMRPDFGGLAVNRNGDVFILNLGGSADEKALYTFEADTIESAADGSRLTQDRKNTFPSAAGANLIAEGMGEYNNELYIYFSQGHTQWRGMSVIPIPSANGTELTRRTGSNTVSISAEGLSVTAEEIWGRIINRVHNTYRLRAFDREKFSQNREIPFYNQSAQTQITIGTGFKVIGNNIYSRDSTYLTIFRINPEVHATRYIWDFHLFLPSGLDNPVFLDALT
ncbi:MAG: hypothetical protein OXH00_26240 [Candidatus Poribacteria bacterium]|nr:hypothetical protein [Candidatus Poribacteria bacterium]